MFCNVCGKENEAVAKFCSSCGQAFNIQKSNMWAEAGKTFFSFRGTLKRKEFAINFIVVLIALIVAGLIANDDSLSRIGGFLGLAGLWSMIVVLTKRIKDTPFPLWLGLPLSLGTPLFIYFFFAKSKNT